MGALLAARDGIGLDDLALIIFFAVVAILKLIQKALQKKAPVEERAPPTEEPEDAGRTRSHRERHAPVHRAPVPAPVASHLADLGGIARGDRADLKQRHAEPPARAAARMGGRALLLARDLPPADRLRQAMVWAEVLRPHRPLRPPSRRRPPQA